MQGKWDGRWPMRWAAVLVVLLAACDLLSPDRGMPAFDEAPGLQRIAPREAWVKVYPDLQVCVADLEATTVHLDDDFSVFRWYTADAGGPRCESNSGCYDDGDILVIDFDERPRKLEFWAVVHELTHHHVPLYWDEDFGHGHPAFEDCDAADLRPERY